MNLTPTLTAPVQPLIAQIAKILREGVAGWLRPSPFAEPYWPDWAHATARTGAPAGHFLLTEGTRMYLDEHKAKVVPPYCVVALAGDPETMDQRVPSAFWRVPVMVQLAWTADQENMEIRERLAMLTGFLTSDYPAVGAQPEQLVADRLSAADVYVYGSDSITAVKPEPLRTEEGHPMLRLSFTVLCSSLATPGIVPNQPETTVLPAPEWADVLDTIAFNQITAAVGVTLNGPTDGSAKALTLTNAGTEAITIAQGGVVVPAAGSVDIVWSDGPAEWVLD